MQQRIKIVFRQRSQFKNLRTRNQRRIDEEKRIVRRRADELHHAAFHVRQQNVLLGFIETMDFVHEQNRGLALVFEAIGRGGQHAPHIRHVGFHAAESLEFALGLAGDDLRQRRFARARRPVENQRLDAVGLDRAAQQLSRAEDMRLPHEFAQVPRTHPRGKGLASGEFRRWTIPRPLVQPELQTGHHAPWRKANIAKCGN